MQQNEHLVFRAHVGIKDAFHSLHFPDDPGLPLYEASTVGCASSVVGCGG